MKEQASTIMGKIVRERMAVLKANPEFKRLGKLLPLTLKGKELGKDIVGITTDPEMANNHIIFLSERDWRRYQAFCVLCDNLATRYRLHWVTVQDLAMGVEQPIVPPRAADTIEAHLDPIVFFPRDFDPNSRYTSRIASVTPIEMVEIMRRLEGLDEKTKEEVKAYLELLLEDKPGRRVLELEKAEGFLEKAKKRISIDVCMRIPIGYTAKEVAEAYRKVDKRRRETVASLGVSVPKRRRATKILFEAGSLRLFDMNVHIYDIVDEMYLEDDLSKDQSRRGTVKRRRHKGRKLLSNRYHD